MMRDRGQWGRVSEASAESLQLSDVHSFFLILLPLPISFHSFPPSPGVGVKR